ncbi:MAG: Crp/Fnr family transcriptional regulator [Rikenellaceae bacterium]|jgi:CRP-like cAMP-binding protein|nr:Crp/Fnr family transcriptional regulator [Rikenellaceae bacterium]
MVSKPKIDETEYTERLFALFPEISDSCRDRIRKHTVIRLVPKGSFIYQEGEVPPGFICLLEGNAKVVKIGINGRGQIVRMVRPKGILGYRALFAQENYRSTAITLDNSVIAIIDRDMLFEIMRENADLSLHILKLIASELGLSNLRTMTLTQKYIRGRLADSLIFLIETYDLTPDGTIDVTLSREDLAQLSSMTTSNAIRTLSAFASEGVVELVGKRIRVPDLDRLKRISVLG